MSRKSEIQNYIDSQLNANSKGVNFKLFYKYGITDDEFSELVFNSVNNPFPNEENEVDIMFDGDIYSTQNGEYSIDNLNYIPCIIEKFSAKFEPLRQDTIISYSVPVSFFVDERLNRENGDYLEEAIEEIQDVIRGRTTSSISGFNTFVNHNDFSPQTGLITINERPFRVYQMVFYFKMTKNGYFGNQIEFYITNTNLFNGLPTQIYPIGIGSKRNNELQSRQIYDTELLKEYEVKSVPDISAYALTLTFVYTGQDLGIHFLQQKEIPGKQQIYTISKKIPGMIPYAYNYILDAISGPEDYDGQLLVTCSFSKVSSEYNG